jgi:formate dehydrogenase
MDEALGQLDLLVAIDLVQRESHRHADWLIPGTHWLEREELHPLFANLQELPYVQYANKAVEKPASVMDEWEFFTELALAMNRNMFGKPGVNRFIRLSRAVAARTGRPALAMNPEWIGRLMVALGRRLKWKDIVAHEHGWVFGEKTYGHLPETVLTEDKRVQVAPPIFVAETTRLLAAPPAHDPAFPMFMSNKRVRESMNSWLNESPGLFKLKRSNVLEIHPDDAGELGIEDSSTVRVSSPVGSVELVAAVTDAMRRGVVCVPHGWGGRVFDPVSGDALDAPGVNRNLLVDSRRIDRFSQTPALNSTMVRVEPVAVAEVLEALSAEPAVVS